uniref:Uncharacterized protein n=1 Tax=Alexandrium catenella TaxID=2925 RepID=A0A7S1R2L8_ALECA|mmetsp:Transcript_42995/g.115914  ORF Transcript_42995/g.115914 Transcript_42995/m.115914 type:complete len:271 (+) Transcript_42995:166-978(+)
MEAWGTAHASSQPAAVDDSSSDHSDGGLFELPSRWDSILAPGLMEDFPLRAGLEHSLSSSSVDGGCLEGDYSYASEDSTSESLLRVLADGQWWHAAHRLVEGEGLLDGPAETWQLVESIGSWYRVPIPGDAVELETSPATGLMLLCENFRWATDSEGLPSQLRPLATTCGKGEHCEPAGMSEVESTVMAGRVLFCYAVCECRLTGARRLELRMPELMCLAASNAMAALGFASQYYKAGHASNGHAVSAHASNGQPRAETVFLGAPDSACA